MIEKNVYNWFWFLCSVMKVWQIFELLAIAWDLAVIFFGGKKKSGPSAEKKEKTWGQKQTPV